MNKEEDEINSILINHLTKLIENQNRILTEISNKIESTTQLIKKSEKFLKAEKKKESKKEDKNGN